MAEKKNTEKTENTEKNTEETAEEARIPGDVLEKAPGREVQDPGSAWKRIDRTQGAYDDTASDDALAEMAESEAKRVEDEKPV